jgi:hypothetical protein
MAFLCGRIENMTVPERIFGNLKPGMRKGIGTGSPIKKGELQG